MGTGAVGPGAGPHRYPPRSRRFRRQRPDSLHRGLPQRLSNDNRITACPAAALSAAELRSAARVRHESTYEQEIHDRLSVNIAFTDRTSFRIQDARWPPSDPSTHAPSEMLVILHDRSGGSAGDFVSIMARRLWFTRLPTSGQVSVTVAWAGILTGRRRLSFHADTIIEAAPSVVPAW